MIAKINRASMAVPVLILEQVSDAVVTLASRESDVTSSLKVARKIHAKMAPPVLKVKGHTYVSVKPGSRAGTVTRRYTSATQTPAETMGVVST